MNIKKSTFFFLLFISYSITIAQNVSDKDILKQIKGKEIEWIAGGNSLAKVLMKSTKKWGIYHIEAYEYSDEEIEELLLDDKFEINFEEVVAPKFDSIGWFKDMEPFIIVKNNKKYGVLMNPYEIPDAVEKVNCMYDAIKIVENDGRFYTLVKQNKKWGLVDWFEDVTLVEPSFDKPEDVPLVWIEPWAKDMFIASKKKLDADILIFDEGNGDGVFKARNKNTKKWGMYQSLGSEALTTLIPANYDSINFFNFNGKYTSVYNEDKVGIYLSYWSYGDKAKQTVPCIYDDYKKFDADGVPKLAVKKNGKWGWINWLTGEEQSDFNYETPEDLPYPYFNQDIWMED
ncbi:WG repeat-containing protein [Xanthomarina gelatinilytica]|uniref:WG repeat-containing protein n=1 Tax=Flavobacteriaceae TaxID=49546 RepID=UPI003AA8B2BA